MRSPRRPSTPATETPPKAVALIQEFLDLGLPRDVLPARAEVIGWLEEWLRLHPEASSDPRAALDELFRHGARDGTRTPLHPYVLRLFVRWLALRGDLTPGAADRLTLRLAPYCDARRFFPS